MTLLRNILILLIGFAVAVFFGQSYLRGILQTHYEDQFSSSVTKVNIDLGPVRLTPQINTIRRKEQRQDGVAQTLQLFYHWPSLNGYTPETASAFNDVENDQTVIFVTIESTLEKFSPPKKRLDSIYRRFFKGKPWRGPNGLIGQALDPKSGYGNEEIYYGRNDKGDVFVTRCLKSEGKNTANLPVTCLYDFELHEGIQVHVRFNKALLPFWLEVSTKIHRKLKTLMQR